MSTPEALPPLFHHFNLVHDLLFRSGSRNAYCLFWHEKSVPRYAQNPHKTWCNPDEYGNNPSAHEEKRALRIKVWKLNEHA